MGGNLKELDGVEPIELTIAGIIIDVIKKLIKLTEESAECGLDLTIITYSIHYTD